MAELPAEIKAEIENIQETLKNLSKTMKRPDKTIIELAALGTFLHNYYNGIENILKQVMKMKQITVPSGENWHKGLLSAAGENGYINEEVSDELFEYLAFRHYFVHSYGFMLKEQYLKELADKAEAVFGRFLEGVKGSI